MNQLHAATKIYKMGELDLRAHNGISLTATEGEMVAIMRTSGSGTSTLSHNGHKQRIFDVDPRPEGALPPGGTVP